MFPWQLLEISLRLITKIINLGRGSYNKNRNKLNLLKRNKDSLENNKKINTTEYIKAEFKNEQTLGENITSLQIKLNCKLKKKI